MVKNQAKYNLKQIGASKPKTLLKTSISQMLQYFKFFKSYLNFFWKLIFLLRCLSAVNINIFYAVFVDSS